MLERDFENCRQTTSADFAQRPFWFQFAVRLARLMAPVLMKIATACANYQYRTEIPVPAKKSSAHLLRPMPARMSH